MKLGLGVLGLRQARVRDRARLRVLRWHSSRLMEVNENTNQGYSQDQGTLKIRLDSSLSCATLTYTTNE